MRQRLGAALAGVMLLAAVTACDAGTQEWGSGSAYSVEGALSQLPPAEAGEPLTIQTADLTAATEMSGLQRPTTLDGVALQEWLGPLLGNPSRETGPAPVFVPLATLFNHQRLQDHQEFADELGWSVLDTDAFVEQATPPHTFAVVAGDLDDSSLAPELPEVTEGVVTAGEGEDFESDLGGVTVARPIGVPLRLAQHDNLIAAGPSTDDVAAWAVGPDETLADHTELAAVAGALDDAGVVSAMLVTGASMGLADALGPVTEAQLEAARAELGPMLPADPFETVGIGWAADDGASVVTAAYHFGSEDAAEAAVGTFEQLFADGDLISSGGQLSDLLVLEHADRDGQVVLLTLAVPDGESPATILNLLMRRDLPFVHR